MQQFFCAIYNQPAFLDKHIHFFKEEAVQASESVVYIPGIEHNTS
jgi:hypothetical protein